MTSCPVELVHYDAAGTLAVADELALCLASHREQ